jgi:hypothetical protein
MAPATIAAPVFGPDRFVDCVCGDRYEERAADKRPRMLCALEWGVLLN